MKLSSLILLMLAGLLAASLAGCQAAQPPAQAAPLPTATPTSAPPTATMVATATRAPSATATPAPSATPTSTPTPRPTATITLTPTPIPQARQLTTGGCCFGPFFLDGKVAFLDRPAADAPAGFYAVSPQGGQPTLIEPRLGTFLNAGTFFSYEEAGKLVIERRSDGKRLDLSSLGDLPGAGGFVLSPDAAAISWSIRETDGPFDQRQTQLWRAALPGGKPERVMTLFGGGLSAWLPDGRWLLSGRRDVKEADRALFIYDFASRQSVELFRASGFRGLSVSPDGVWVALSVALDPQRERNGLWLLRTDGRDRRKLDFFGSFVWRDAGHLLYIPFQAEAKSHEVWVYSLAAGRSRRLTDASLTPFKIAQGDFVFSPDRRALVYVSAEDLNLWWLPLPEISEE